MKIYQRESIKRSSALPLSLEVERMDCSRSEISIRSGATLAAQGLQRYSTCPGCHFMSAYVSFSILSLGLLLSVVRLS